MLLPAAALIAAAIVARGFRPPAPVASAPPPEPGVGRAAPDFVLSSLTGGEAIGLRQFRGRPVVLNFWASWCVPCRREAPNLHRAWQSYRGRGVVFLGVDVQDTEADARAFIAEFKVPYPSVRDPSQHVMTAYNVWGLPTTVFIDGTGRIRRQYTGAFLEEQGWRRLSTFIEELLAGAGR